MTITAAGLDSPRQPSDDLRALNLAPFRLPTATALLGILTAVSASAQTPSGFSSAIYGGTPAQLPTLANVVLNPLIVAGDPSASAIPGPDSPAQRIDPNVASSPYAGVVSLFIDAPGAGGFLCTGTVLSPRTVLTAAHCVDYDNNGSIDAAPSDITVVFNQTAATATRTGAGVYVHPDFTGFNNPAVNDDLAIVKLTSDVPAGVPSYPLLSAGSIDVTSEIFKGTFVGYGRTGDGIAGYTSSGSFTVKSTGANLIEAYDLDDEASGNPELWYADFEQTTGGVVIPGPPFDVYDGNPAHDALGFLTGFDFPLTLGNTVESNTGPGDSGGPLFVEGPGGQIFLAGTSTFGANFFNTNPGGFGSLNGGIWIESYTGWVNQMTALPEPSTYAAALALGALGFVTWRRQRRA